MMTQYKTYTIHYEVYGQGDPIIFLNGIMMSTNSWHFLLSAFPNHQVILIDMLDQGKSSDASNYNISDQGDVVIHVMNTLALTKVHLVGISYGGEVALDVAIKNPQAIQTLQLFNTACYTDAPLYALGLNWLSMTKNHEGDAFYDATINNIYGQTFKNENDAWMREREQILRPIFNLPTFLDRLHRLTQSSQTTDLREQLKSINSPTLVVSGSEDTLIPLNYQQEICTYIPHATHVIVEKSGHALMYEAPKAFVSLVLGMVHSGHVTLSI